jgi:hypothetical protein
MANDAKMDGGGRGVTGVETGKFEILGDGTSADVASNLTSITNYTLSPVFRDTQAVLQGIGTSQPLPVLYAAATSLVASATGTAFGYVLESTTVTFIRGGTAHGDEDIFCFYRLEGQT